MPDEEGRRREEKRGWKEGGEERVEGGRGREGGRREWKKGGEERVEGGRGREGGRAGKKT